MNIDKVAKKLLETAKAQILNKEDVTAKAVFIRKNKIDEIELPNFMFAPGAKDLLAETLKAAVEAMEPDWLVFLSDTWVVEQDKKYTPIAGSYEFVEGRKEAIQLLIESNFEKFMISQVYDRDSDNNPIFEEVRNTRGTKIDSQGRFVNLLYNPENEKDEPLVK